jgi:hypothetical protein
MVMLNQDDANVLSYVRTPPMGGEPVVVAMNMSAEPRMVSFNLKAEGIRATEAKTLAASDPSLMGVISLASVRLPPFTAWIATVK